jgi:hypothetical protein
MQRSDHRGHVADGHPAGDDHDELPLALRRGHQVRPRSLRNTGSVHPSGGMLFGRHHVHRHAAGSIEFIAPLMVCYRTV